MMDYLTAKAIRKEVNTMLGIDLTIPEMNDMTLISYTDTAKIYAIEKDCFAIGVKVEGTKGIVSRINMSVVPRAKLA